MSLCGLNTMPCVISWWSPNLVSVIFVTTKSDLGQCLFTLDDAFFPAAHGGKRFLDCGSGCCLCGQETTCKRGLIWCALSATHGGREKPWEYRWGCCPWGQESAYQRGQYHASCEWVDCLTGLCGSVMHWW